jgi:endonuclease/exonuclease/phosphatase family metal-dependent hydrolase
MFGFKKIIFMLVITILLSGFVATPLTALAGSEDIKVAVVVEYADYWMTQVKPSFENENIGVNIELEFMQWEPLYDKIIAILEGRIIDCYDVVMMKSSKLPELIEYAEDLTDHRKDFESAGIDFVEYNGRILGVSSPGPDVNQDWMLIISKNSKNKELALELLKFAGGGSLLDFIPTELAGFTDAPLSASLSVKFFTQNAQLLPSFSPAIDERVPCIIDLISVYHIIGLQEVFKEDSQDRIIKAWYNKIAKTPKCISLKKGILEREKKDLAQLKAIDARPNKEEAQIVYDEYFVMGPDKKDIPEDGGLTILSTYPIIAVSGFVYSKSLLPDSLASKGALYARINLAPASKIKDCYIHVFVTHMQATRKYKPKECVKVRKSQFAELKKFMQNATAAKDGKYDGYPIVLMGDFNVIADKAANSEYRDMLKTLDLKLEDVWDKLKPKSLGHTWIGMNQTTSFHSPWGNLGNTLATESVKPQKQRIDYFFYRPGTKLKLKPKSIELVPSTSKSDSLLYCFDKQIKNQTICKKIKPQVTCKLKSYTVADHLGLKMICDVTP